MTWSCITAPPNVHSPRAIIISTLKNWTVVQTTRDQVTGYIKIGNDNLVFSSFYIPAGDAGLEAFLMCSENIIQRYRDQALILAGDANAKNELWGGSALDPRGRAIEDFITSNGLCVFNDNLSLPTYERGTRRSWIDVTLGNGSGRPRVRGWEVEDHDTQDHRNILFNLEYEGTSSNDNGSPRFCLKYGKWGKFLKLIRQQEDYLLPRLQNTTTAGDVNTWYEEFHQVLTDICNVCFQRKKLGRRNVELTWWTEELKIKKKQVAAARRRKQRAPDEIKVQMVCLYNRVCAQYKRLIVKAKRTAWLETCANIKNTYGLPYRALKGTLSRPTTLPVVRVGDRTTSTPEESLKVIVDGLFPEDTEPRNRAQEEVHRKAHSGCPGLGADEPPFTETEITGVITSLPNNKAPGPDLFNYEIVRSLYQGTPALLVTLFNKCLETGCFPSRWKEGEIVLLKKAGGREDDPSSLRPICLLPTLGKVFEKLILNRLLYFCFSKNIIADRQFGFLPHRSTTQAHDLVNRTIGSNFVNNVGTLMISIDIKNAFNSVWHDSIRHFMRLHAFPRNIYVILDDYFKDRWVQANFADFSYRKLVRRGCPQGSGLGPFMWNTVINDFLRVSFPANFSIQAYADDLLVLIGGNHRARLKEDVQFVFRKIYDWADSNKLSINKDKTKAIWIPGRDRNLLLSKTKIPEIKLSEHLKYLGITYSADGTFGEHLKNVAGRIQQINRKIRSVKVGKRGISNDSLRTIYKTVIEKIITFGAETWSRNLKRAQVSKLISLQRAVLLSLTGAYRTTSTEALQIIANIAPLDLVVAAERKRADILQNNKCVEILGRRISAAEVETGSHRFRIHPRDWMRIDWKEFKDDHNDIPKIFTDGSRSQEGTGAAFVVLRRNMIVHTGKYSLDKDNTHYQAEGVAILEAIKWAIDNPQHNEVSIITDCQAVLRALGQVNSNGSIVDQIKRATCKILREGRRIQFFWTRGHAGQYGNELADAAAKEAVTAENRYQIRKPVSWVKHLLRKEVATTWNQRWTESTKGRDTFSVIESTSTRNWFYSKEITQLLTQHGRIPRYMFKFGFTSSPNCVCGEVGSIDHYIFRCDTTRNAAGHVRKLQNIKNIVKNLGRHHVRNAVERVIRFVNVNLASLMQDPGRVRDFIPQG